jgi:hypothetical protein
MIGKRQEDDNLYQIKHFPENPQKYIDGPQHINHITISSRTFA